MIHKQAWLTGTQGYLEYHPGELPTIIYQCLAKELAKKKMK